MNLLTVQCFHDSGMGLLRLSTQQHSHDVAAIIRVDTVQWSMDLHNYYYESYLSS